MDLTTYAALDEYLGKRDKKRPPTNKANTWLVRRGTDIAVLLHYTDVITFHENGTVTIDPGGWFTTITTNRVNGYLPDYFSISLSQRKNRGGLHFYGRRMMSLEATLYRPLNLSTVLGVTPAQHEIMMRLLRDDWRVGLDDAIEMAKLV